MYVAFLCVDGMGRDEIELLYMHYDKVDLENLIFWMAAWQRREVWALRGRLMIKGGSGVLNKLVVLYNQLFAAENRRLLKEELAREAKEDYLFAQRYLVEVLDYPLEKSFHLP